MTAAPRITEASGEVILPASISVRAEIETLVAVSAPPRNQAAFQLIPRRCATPAPRKKGQITPSKATKNAVGPASRMRSMSVSRPAINISTSPPICAKEQKCVPGSCAAEEGLMQDVQETRAGGHPDQKLTENCRNPESLGERSENFSSRKQDGDQQRQLQISGHCRYLDPASTGAVSGLFGPAARRSQLGQ